MANVRLGPIRPVSDYGIYIPGYQDIYPLPVGGPTVADAGPPYRPGANPAEIQAARQAANGLPVAADPRMAPGGALAEAINGRFGRRMTRPMPLTSASAGEAIGPLLQQLESGPAVANRAASVPRSLAGTPALSNAMVPELMQQRQADIALGEANMPADLRALTQKLAANQQILNAGPGAAAAQQAANTDARMQMAADLARQRSQPVSPVTLGVRPGSATPADLAAGAAVRAAEARSTPIQERDPTSFLSAADRGVNVINRGLRRGFLREGGIDPAQAMLFQRAGVLPMAERGNPESRVVNGRMVGGDPRPTIRQPDPAGKLDVLAGLLFGGPGGGQAAANNNLGIDRLPMEQQLAAAQAEQLQAGAEKTRREAALMTPQNAIINALLGIAGSSPEAVGAMMPYLLPPLRSALEPPKTAGVVPPGVDVKGGYSMGPVVSLNPPNPLSQPKYGFQSMINGLAPSGQAGQPAGATAQNKALDVLAMSGANPGKVAEIRAGVVGNNVTADLDSLFKNTNTVTGIGRTTEDEFVAEAAKSPDTAMIPEEMVREYIRRKKPVDPTMRGISGAVGDPFNAIVAGGLFAPTFGASVFLPPLLNKLGIGDMARNVLPMLQPNLPKEPVY